MARVGWHGLMRVSPVRDERDDAHLPTAQRTQQGEHPLNAGDQTPLRLPEPVTSGGSSARLIGRCHPPC